MSVTPATTAAPTTRSDNSAAHAQGLESDFVDRFAVVGPPDVCAARLLELQALGINRFVITGASFGAGGDVARESHRLMATELLPALRTGASA